MHDPEDGAAQPPRRNLYGRRHGKKLKPSQRRLIEELLPRLRIPGVSPEENPGRTPLTPFQGNASHGASSSGLIGKVRAVDRVVMLSAGRTVFEGAIPDAAALSPHGAEVVTDDGEGLMAAALSIGGHAISLGNGMGEARRWQVLLPRNVTHPALVRALAEHGVPILNFQPIQASLEGAFWRLAQPAKSRAA